MPELRTIRHGPPTSKATGLSCVAKTDEQVPGRCYDPWQHQYQGHAHLTSSLEITIDLAGGVSHSTK